MRRTKIKQVDAFTSIPFGGNPAGVVTDAGEMDDEIKQKIAAEMNLSETAFVSPSMIADFKVQFFTPRFEVDLCGHATIATFSTLYEEGRLNLDKKQYFQETKAGVLPVELVEIRGQQVFMMTQTPPRFITIDMERHRIAKLMGLNEGDLLDTPIMKVSTGLWWMVFGVKCLDRLMNIKPDLRGIEEISRQYGIIGITPFCMETLDEECSYHLRAIAPYVGIAEDPVCGTGNGSVASYILYNKLLNLEKKIHLIGEQGIEVNRPGRVFVGISGENGEIREVKIGGSAITVLEGELRY